MSQIARQLLAGLLGLLGMVLATSAAAERYALLVGVGRYPNLGPEHQLPAPPNDVRRMRNVLLQRGFTPEHVTLLTDGTDGAREPTRAAIVAALESLAQRARPGDLVLLHFAGHGTRLPLPPEPGAAPGASLRWQPVFLPRDVQRADGALGPHPQAISDVQLRSLVDSIQDRGVFIVGIFDACHSARLVRAGQGAGAPRPREVPPAVLGVAATPPDEVPPWWARPDQDYNLGDGAAAGRRAGRGRAVYFYAAQSVEQATTALQAVGDGAAPLPHGLLSWYVAQALEDARPMRWRQLAQYLQWRYERSDGATATPLASGDGLDDPVLDATAPLLRQWPLELANAGLSLPAGALHGLADGALLAVVADPRSPPAGDPLQPPVGAIGFVRVTALGTDRSLVSPVAWQGWAAPSPTALRSGTWARLAWNPPAYTLRVAVDLSTCHASCIGGRALAKLQATGVAGVALKWVQPEAAPDVIAQAQDAAIRLLRPGLETTDGPAWGARTRAEGDEGSRVQALAQNLSAALHRIARSRNLLRLAAAIADRPRSGLLADAQVHVSLRRIGSTAATQLVPQTQTPARPGDSIELRLHNLNPDAMDFAAFWIGVDNSIQRIWPTRADDASRIDGGATAPLLTFALQPGGRGAGQLVVLWTPQRKGREAQDFAFLAQAPLSLLRGGGDDPALQALQDACFADHLLRSEAVPAPPAPNLGLQVYGLWVDGR